MRELERQFGDDLAIIGVHAGKFIAERVTANIRQAVLRLGVEHPVVNDRAFRTWREYAVNAWPTLVLIDAQGRVVDQHPGEITAASYGPTISAVIDEAARRGALRHGPLPLQPESASEPARPLHFPSKVLAAGRRLFIADTGHQRIVSVALGEGGTSGTVEFIAGSGREGMDDGALAAATFNHPQGLALHEGTLYVADTRNHAIRVLDLAQGEVTTIAGTGRPLHRFLPAASPREVPLSSPWDLAVHEGELYIAMAGRHQIWRLDPSSGRVEPYIGGGYEDLMDGPNAGAALAQPSGVSAADGRLYFADAESSAIREASLAPEDSVRTLAGTGLFDFGDRDGIGDEVRLQHPQGIAWHQGTLYVADTYNGKIKTIDPQTRQVETLAEGDFYEPGGLSAGDGRLYVADTNNHAIRLVDLETGEVGTLEIEGL